MRAATLGGGRIPEINVVYPLYGLSGTITNGNSSDSQVLDTRGVSRALVMLCITAVASAPSPTIHLVGLSAINGTNKFSNLAHGNLVNEERKRYVALAAAPGRECFWFNVFAPFTAVRVSVNSGAGDSITISGNADSRPWIVLQRAITDEDVV